MVVSAGAQGFSIHGVPMVDLILRGVCDGDDVTHPDVKLHVPGFAPGYKLVWAVLQVQAVLLVADFPI